MKAPKKTTIIQTISDNARILLRPLLFPYKSGKFHGKRILVDAGHFNDCVFTDCVIVIYGRHCVLNDCAFVNCLFWYEGTAARTITILKLLYHRMGGDGMKRQIEELIAGPSNISGDGQ